MLLNFVKCIFLHDYQISWNISSSLILWLFIPFCNLCINGLPSLKKRKAIREHKIGSQQKIVGDFCLLLNWNKWLWTEEDNDDIKLSLLKLIVCTFLHKSVENSVG